VLRAEMPQQSYWTGDIPPAPLVIDLLDDDGDVDTSPFPLVWANLIAPDGDNRRLIPAAIVGDTIVAEWPNITPFDLPGIYSLVVTLMGTNASTGLAPLQFVVESVDGWHTLDSARAQWPDAPSDDVVLYTLLDGARTAVNAYAPPLEPSAQIPLPFRQAQLMQTRAVWNATKTNDQSEIGPDGFAIRVYPLDKNIRQLLRPKTALPVIW